MKLPGFSTLIAVFFGLLLAGSAQAMTVLLVVVNTASLTAEETANKTQFQSWGYTVTTVAQGDTQANITAAANAADVVYVPYTIQEWVLTSELRTTSKGVVCSENQEDAYMGFSTSPGWTFSTTQINITNNTHYITSPFSTGLLTIFNASNTVNLMNTTYATGLQKLGDQNSGSNGLCVMDPGAALAQTTSGNSTASGRRVRLCWGGDAFTISSLNSNGLTILQRSLLWAANMTNGIAAQWKLDEASGTSAADASGSLHTGTVTGTATWTTGVIHNGFSFNGATKIQATGLMSSPANVSVTAWANLTAADTSGAEIISLGDHFGLRLDTGGVSEVFFYNGSTYVTATIAKTYAGTGWHHFAGVFDDTSNSLKLYVDGALASTTSTANSISYSGLGANTVIGRHGNASTNYDFTGTIDDVRVYNYALSAAEVINVYGLVGYWKLNEASGTSASDSSGNSYTGTVTGTASWVAGMFGNGFSFNGTTKIQATGLMGSPTSFTLAAWVNLSGAGGNGAEVISLGDHAVIRLDVSSSTRAYFYDGSAWQSVSYAKTFSGTGWHHFAAVFDGDFNTYKLYVDGVQAATASFASPVSFAGLGSNTVLGRHGNGGSGYDLTGVEDDVRVYNYPLSATAIAELYGLIGYWKLDETTGTTAADSSPMGRSGTVTGTATWSSSIVNNGFSFNGASKIQVTGLLNAPKSVSVAAWVNLTTADTGGSEVVSLGDHFSLRVDESGATKVYYYNGSAWNSLSYTETLAGTGWHHLVAQFDDDNDLLKLYVDGKLAGSTAAASSISYAGQGANTVIGQQGNGGTTQDFTGRIDEVRVYNYVISASTVAELYGLIGYWKLDEASGTSAADSSYFADNGTVTGTATWTAGKVNGGESFNYSDGDDYVTIPNSSQLNSVQQSSFSIAAWFKANSTPPAANSNEDYYAILTKAGSSPVGIGYRGDNKFEINQFLSTGSNYEAISPSTYSPGSFHHLVGTFDMTAGQLKLYMDGQLVTTTAFTAGTAGINDGTLQWHIGICTPGGASLKFDADGAADDVRIYNRVITAEEVSQLFGTGFSGVTITKWIEQQ